MEWQQLVGFYHAARLGSFTKAAAATFRTQSALSQQVKALEAELNCQLLERLNRKKLRLTPAGEEVWRFAEAVLLGYEQLQAQLQAGRDPTAGSLRLAAPFTTIYHLFRQVLGEYQRAWPGVRLTILDRPQAEIIALVREGEVDLGFALASRTPADLTVRPWLSVEPFLLVPVDHPLTQVAEIGWPEVARYPLILPPAKTPPRDRIERQLQHLGLAYHVILESANVELSALYVELGLGLAPATLVSSDLPELRQRRLAYLPFSQLAPPDTLVILQRRNKVLLPYQQAFLECLSSHFPSRNGRRPELKE
ncbi:MAG: LysR family transcriptional regulator [Deltaproteobacteria bacterium]|nr:LysR family transcriptional regulator [Deltaproteobacteria bacterium]